MLGGGVTNPERMITAKGYRIWLIGLVAVLAGGCDAAGPESRTRPNDNPIAMADIERARTRSSDLLAGHAPEKEKCGQFEVAVNQIESMSANYVQFTENGTIVLGAELWSKIPPDQQRQMIDFASARNKCKNGSGAVAVLDADTRKILARKGA